MARRVRVVTAPELRARIAAAYVERRSISRRLGRIELRPHQLAALVRIHQALLEFGGALLADAVGLGKTFVALAVARRYAAPLVVAPAVLRSTWSEASGTTGVRVAFATTESLSRRAPAATPDLVVVDEAHHFRSRGTRRYAHLAELCATVPVLLLSATPVHNRAADLDALLALFLGSRAGLLPAEELGDCLLRREHSDVPQLQLPRLTNAKRLVMTTDARLTEAIAALPPPLPLHNGHGGIGLVRLGLLHMLASSDAALRAGLRRRLTRGAALRHALEQGRRPSAREIRAWVGDADSVQLGFADLLVDTSCATDQHTLDALDLHLNALREVRRLLDRLTFGDEQRNATLREIRAAHRAERVVAFSSYSETVRALYRSLERDGAVAAVSGSGGWIASGRVGREEVLRMFREPAHERERVQLLLATDLLSEGLNLPEAAVVVHLDLPWTAARVEQRVGRLRRPGQRSDRITSYVFAPSPAIERLISKELRLAKKAAIAEDRVGSLLVAPAPGRTASPARALELTRRLVERWQEPEVAQSGDARLVAAVRAERRGFIAVVQAPCGQRVACGTTAGGATFDPRLLHSVLSDATGPATTVPPRQYLATRRALERLLRRRRQRSLVPDREPSADVAAVLRRLHRIVARTPPHERGSVAGRAAALNTRLSGRLTAGLELQLHRALTVSDAEFLEACERLLEAAGEPRPAPDYELKAVLLLVNNDST